MRFSSLVAAAVVLCGTSAFAQAPHIVNAALQERAVAGPLEPFFQGLVRQQSKPAWIGYSVPVVPGHRAGCWGTGDLHTPSSPYYLEGRPASATGAGDRAVRLEGDATVLVLFRVEKEQVGTIAIFSPECELDAGGLPFFVLTGVVPADSVHLLTTFARGDNANGPAARTAMTAMALHADPSADTALEQLVAPSQPLDIRKRAAFWLGVARADKGFEILRAAVDHDPSAEFRKEATFALSQSPVAAAIDALIAMARADGDASVRGQALFWLAQKAGKKAAGVITDAIANDPDTQVKERAVFALSQLPKEEGVPLLINVARSNRNPRVRERAMFWLGQSKDPRAVAFFEEVLKAK